MTIPSSAVFVAADEPLLVFASAADAQDYLEAIDVEDGVYSAAYGVNGEIYSITVDDGLVFVERTNEPHRPADLRSLLLKYLDALGLSGASSQSLNDLAEIAWAEASGS